MIPIVLRNELDDAFDHIGRSFLSQFRKERLQGKPGIKSRGSHGIYKYFQRKKLAPTHDLMDMGIKIYSKSKIAAMHETGAEITGELKVPLTARKKMFTASGQLKKRFKAPRLLKNTAVIKLKGKDYLVKFRSKRNRSIKEAPGVYVLKNKIRIKPRLEFIKTFNRHAPRRIQILNKAVVKAMKRV